ncbi:MAG: glucose-1-phosphate adenylyltransferase [Anaerolineae bacterium]|nr:glucose-1-phosphate adenylyltransferase [Anaerolineae bacterium]
MRVLALILAGGQGTRLSILSQKRAKPAVPFAGKYRIIDFPLSNCVNSDIVTIGIATQYRPRSLNDHIRNGRPWDLDRMYGGVTLLQPYEVSQGIQPWYRGTADAVYQNQDFVLHHHPAQTLILASDHIYKMDYGPLLGYHQSRQADLTVCAFRVPISEASRFGILTLALDESGRVARFEEKPQHPQSDLASMGIYVFNTQTMLRLLDEDAANPESRHDFGRDVLPRMVSEGYRVFCYQFDNYWVDVGTVQAYWEAHMDLLEENPLLNLLDRGWVIHTRSEERPPVNIRTGASIGHSLISDGCVIEGAVEYSVLSPGVCVRQGAIVRNSIVMTDAVIEEMTVVDRAILDKNVRIGARSRVGYGNDMHVPNETESYLNTGITLVGKNTVIPPRMTVGRNCVIASDLPAQAFEAETLESGRTVDPTSG